MFTRLMGKLSPQLSKQVRVLKLEDRGELSIGEKRQRLLEASTAQWVSFIDDDDMVASNYCSRILRTIKSEPADIIGFRLRYFVDGEPGGLAVHSYDADKIETPDLQKGHRRFNRVPNHLNPVRRSLALRIGYKPLNFGEDGDYATRLQKLQPREVFLDWYAYDYLYRTKRNGERTNDSRTSR